MSDFHTRLHESIRRSGLTLDELSAISGVSTKTIQNWTKSASPSMPRLDQGVKVAIVLGVPAEFLVTGEAHRGFSKKGLEIALAAEKLSDEGKAVALTQVESLAVHFSVRRRRGLLLQRDAVKNPETT